MSEQKHPVQAFFIALLGLIIFAAIYFLACLVLSGVLSVLMKIPLVSTILSFTMKLTGNTLSWAVILLASYLSIVISLYVSEKLASNRPTYRLCALIIGVVLVAVHSVSLILNIIYGESFFANIAQGIAGVIAIASRDKM